MPSASTSSSDVSEPAAQTAQLVPISSPTRSQSIPCSSQESTTVFSLSLWILSPLIRYSSTQTNGQELFQELRGEKTSKDGKAAMKVFWKAISLDEANTLIEKPEVEDLTLPLDAVTSLRAHLCDSALLLPESSQRFQGWEVGLLERYEET